MRKFKAGMCLLGAVVLSYVIGFLAQYYEPSWFSVPTVVWGIMIIMALLFASYYYST